MRILCPDCSRKEPLAIEVSPEEEAVVCPSCSRRYRLRTRRILDVEARYSDRGYAYRLQTAEPNGARGVQRILSQSGLQISGQHTVTIVRRGGSVVGLADQDAQTWISVRPVEPRFPLGRRLLLSLAWPVTLLAALQAVRFWIDSAALLQSDPLAAIVLLGLLGSLALAPVIWWLLRVVFPDGPRRRQLIRGWSGGDIDDP
jgi:hypothetical protein